MKLLALILFSVLILLALPQAAILPLLDRDEPRFSEASREMLQSGDLVVPTCNGLPRYQKPPLIYWAQSLAFLVFGENELAARLPSLLATAGTALVLLIWAAREKSHVSVTITAALLSALTLQMMIQGRVATADAVLIFFITLTAWSGWELIKIDQAARKFFLWSRWIFWGCVLTFALALGFLTKGPAALFPLLPLLFFLTHGRSRLAILACLSLSLALVSIWAIPAYLQTNGDYWFEEWNHNLLAHTTEAKDGHGATNLLWYILLLPFYFLTFWISALPVSPLVMIYRKKLFTTKNHRSLDRYLLTNAALIFLIFTLMVSKLPHYTLPAFPLLAFYFARRWETLGFARWLPSYLLVGFAALFAALMAGTGKISPAKNLVSQAQPDLTESTSFATLDYHERSVTWEMRHWVRPYHQELSQEEALNFLKSPGHQALFLPTSIWKQWEQTSSPPSNWKIYHTQGLDSAKLLIYTKDTGLRVAWIDLTLILKSEPTP